MNTFSNDCCFYDAILSDITTQLLWDVSTQCLRSHKMPTCCERHTYSSDVEIVSKQFAERDYQSVHNQNWLVLVSICMYTWSCPMQTSFQESFRFLSTITLKPKYTLWTDDLPILQQYGPLCFLFYLQLSPYFNPLLDEKLFTNCPVQFFPLHSVKLHDFFSSSSILPSSSPYVCSWCSIYYYVVPMLSWRLALPISIVFVLISLTIYVVTIHLFVFRTRLTARDCPIGVGKVT